MGGTSRSSTLPAGTLAANASAPARPSRRARNAARTCRGGDMPAFKHRCMDSARVVARFAGRRAHAAEETVIEPILLAAMLSAAVPHAHVAALDTAKIERLTGAKGRLNAAEGVFKVS